MRPPPSRKTTDGGNKNGWGLTVVEILVALVILTVGILALGLLSGQFNRQTNISDLAIERSASLQSAIEEIRSTPLEDVAAGSVTIDPRSKDIGAFS